MIHGSVAGSPTAMGRLNVFYTLSCDAEWRKQAQKMTQPDTLLRYTQDKAIASGEEKCGWTALTVSAMDAVGAILFTE